MVDLGSNFGHDSSNTDALPSHSLHRFIHNLFKLKGLLLSSLRVPIPLPRSRIHAQDRYKYSITKRLCLSGTEDPDMAGEIPHSSDRVRLVEV